MSAVNGISIPSDGQIKKRQVLAVLINQGVACFNEGKYNEAVKYYRAALAEDPNCGEAYINLAAVCFVSDQIELMWENTNKALALAPDNAEFFLRASVFARRNNDYLKSIELANCAIELNPDLKEAWASLATAYQEIGNAPTVKKLYERMIARFPDEPLFKLQHAWLLPAIYDSREEIAIYHKGFIDNLDRLIKDGITVPVPNIGQLFPFHQGYHGLNNVALMKKLAEFFLRCCPDVHFTAPHCLKPGVRASKEKIRIGIVSHMMHMKTLNQFFLKTIEGLAADPELEVILFSSSDARSPDARLQLVKQVHIPLGLARPREIIAAEEPDILIYLEIGMSNQSYFIAMARLAPIQCILGGHPITTGLPTMDYFISTSGGEPEGAQAHYTETLIQSDGGSVVFIRPEVPKAVKSRRELGLPEDKHIYACPVTLFKLHPDMDQVFAAILERDPKAIILLFDSRYKTLWRSQLQKRFASHMPEELSKRIVFIPFAPKELFFHILRAADVVLDSFHFSFGQTAFMMVAANIPFVTWPGEFLRGRAGYWIYQHRLHLPEMIAPTHEAYIDLALKLANDKAFYNEMSQKINERSDALFDDTAVAGRFGTVLKRLYATQQRKE